MGSADEYLETPLVHSTHISHRLGIDAYLKMENLQPSQSFKHRGISRFIEQCKESHGDNLHVIAASGGNAGLSVACIANKLGIKCTVFIPNGANSGIINYLRQEKSEIVIWGDYYVEALRKAEHTVATNPHAVLVPAYDHPILWEGHSSMIAEVSRQLDRKPGVIVCSVGGGGLLVPIVAVETLGANCFYSSMALNSNWAGTSGVPNDIDIVTEADGVKIAHIKKLTSKATSLAATSPSSGVIRMALARRGSVRCLSVSDEMTMSAACSFADEHKMLVELACAATLTPAYEPRLMARLSETNGEPKTAVFILCGGFKVSLEQMEEYRTTVRQELETGKNDWECVCDGVRWNIQKTMSIER